ncbi:MAG: gliding motility-associated C-terminal domain-containing protein [Cyclobacteriaceae bacterium]
MIKRQFLFLLLYCISLLSFSQKLYIAENGSNLIQRSNANGTSLGPISTAGQVGPIRDIAIDQERNFAYWIEATTPTLIKRAPIESNAGGVQLGTVTDFVNISTPPTNFQSLVINPNSRELLVSNGGDIFKFNLDVSSTFIALPAALISGQSSIPGFDIDLQNSKIYFIRAITPREIRIVNLDGTGLITTIVPNLLNTESMQDIAVDTVGGKFYYSNANPQNSEGEIVVRDLDTGANRVTIVKTLANTIRGIAIDPGNGHIFWADGFSKIGRADLDGSNAIDIVPSGLDAPFDVALDLSNPNPPKIYWTENVGAAIGGDDEIHRVDLDGNDFEVPYSGFSAEISGIEVDEANNLVYWTDAARAEIFSGEIGETSFANNRKLIDFNPTGAANLQDLALDVPNDLLYFTHANANNSSFENYISTAVISAPDPNTTVVDIIDLGPNDEPYGIDIDFTNSKIYFTTNNVTSGTNSRLYRADLDGSNMEELFYLGTSTVGGTFFRDVKIDPVNEIVYWSVGAVDASPGEIYYNDLNEAAPFASPTIFSFNGEPRGIDLDLINNKIYWVCRGANNGTNPVQIMRADLDGAAASFEIVHVVDVFPAGYPTSPPGSAFIALDLRGLASPNTAPVLNPSSSSATYAGNPVFVNSSIAVSDADDVDLGFGSVQFSLSTFVPGEDQLLFDTQGTLVSGNYNSSTGVLSLSGTASLADYQTVLRSVQYLNSATSTPTTTARSIEFQVSDGTDASNLATTTLSINLSATNQPPVFTPSTLATVINGSVTLTLTDIVSDPDNNLDPATFAIVQQPVSGASASISNAVLSIDYANTTFAGQDNIIVEVFDLLGERAEATILIDVEGTVVVFNGISPNGDGSNDFFELRNIEFFEPQNKVSIFNRWGDKVFEVENYVNTDPTKRFNGESDKGKALPSGVYFYRVEFTSGSPALEGYLTLKR